jgi:uncharacterized Zn finger protein
MESIAPPSTRELRGITLFKEHGHEITHEGHGHYEVPGCSGGTYTVDLAIGGGEESCSCPDRAPICKHLIAATIFRAKARATARREQGERTAARATAANVAGLVASL